MHMNYNRYIITIIMMIIIIKFKKHKHDDFKTYKYDNHINESFDDKLTIMIF